MDNKEYRKIQEDRSSTSYDRGEGSPWLYDFFNKYSKYIESPVLEIGCANGKALEYLTEKGFFVIGADISRDPIWHCLNHKKPLPAIWHDAQDPFPFPDKTFRTVIMFHCFEHMLYPEKVLENIDRILNGNLCIVGPVEGKVNEQYAHFSTFENYDEYKKIFKNYKILEFNEEIHPGNTLVATNAKDKHEYTQ